MKKLIYFILIILLICIIFTGCAKKNDNITESSLQLINEVQDKYGNLLQQIFYNESSNEYIFKEYTYRLVDNKFICIDQQTTIINYASKDDEKYDEYNNNLLTIFYNKDLINNPIILLDTEDIKISVIKYLAADKWWEFGYELKIVNKSNKILSVLIDDVSIMSNRCDPLFDVEHIDAGQTCYFTLAWQKEELERCYIPYIDNIEFMIRVYDNNDWSTPAITGKKILIKQ
jgi:hypothetical protein